MSYSRIESLPRELQDELLWYLTGEELLAYCRGRKCDKKFWRKKAQQDFGAGEAETREQYHLYVLANKLGLRPVEKPYDMGWEITTAILPVKDYVPRPKLNVEGIRLLLSNPITADNLISRSSNEHKLFKYLWDNFPNLHFFLVVHDITENKGRYVRSKDFVINVKDLVPWLVGDKTLEKELRKIIHV